jgi:hypothetical protein
VQEADRESASLAVQVTVVVPTGSSDPDAGEQLVVTGCAPPVTTAFPKLTATGAPFGDTVGEIVGQLMDGKADVTTTAVLHEATCWVASVAVQVTAVVPTGKVDPEAGAHAVVIGAVPPVVVGLPNVTATGAPFGDATAGGTLQTMENGSGGAVAATSGDGSLSTPALLYAWTTK